MPGAGIELRLPIAAQMDVVEALMLAVIVAFDAANQDITQITVHKIDSAYTIYTS